MTKSLTYIAFCFFLSLTNIFGDVKLFTYKGKEFTASDINLKGSHSNLDKISSTPAFLTPISFYLLNKIIDDEVKRKNILIDKDSIIEEAKELSDTIYSNLGKDDSSRNHAMEAIRQKMSALDKAMTLWQQNEELGNKFAQEELSKQNISMTEWNAHLKAFQSDSKYLEKIKKAVGLSKDDIVKDNLKVVENRIKVKLLKEVLFSDIEVSAREIKNAVSLDENLESLSVIIFKVDSAKLNSLSLIDMKELFESQKAQLAPVMFSADQVKTSWKNPKGKILCNLAIHADDTIGDPSIRLEYPEDGVTEVYFINQISFRSPFVSYKKDSIKKFREILFQHKTKSLFRKWLKKQIEDSVVFSDVNLSKEISSLNYSHF